MFEKLEHLQAEYAELNERLTDNAVLSNHAEVTRVSQRLNELKPVVEAFAAWKKAEADLAEAEKLLRESSDPELRAMAAEELKALKSEVARLEPELKRALLPKDPLDGKNVILEIRAGTGGEEAALFVADLYRMYLRFADRQGWRVEETNRNETGLGGLKEVVATIEGQNVYSRLKFESGTHRVQRVPQTEASGRIHTSAVTVAILPEAEDIDVQILDKDLKIDTYRSQGAGGQHVNKTESAIRITHIPTGVVVTCQEEKSQHKNRAKAMKVLRAKLLEHKINAANAERAADRKSQVGSGDRSERIRTYNFPQNRVTDHRINMTLYSLPQFMDGQIDEMVDALVAANVAEKLAAAEIH